VSAGNQEFAERLNELRESFDRSFALPRADTSRSFVGMVAIRVSKGQYALRIDELADVQSACKVVPLPRARSEMIGLAGIRGRLVAVYSLAALLGHGDTKGWNWLAICNSGQSLALAFDDLEGYLQAPKADLYPAAEVDGTRAHVGEVLRSDNVTRIVVSTSSIIAMLRDSDSAWKGRGL
jgi:chemotaxis signal transduction protein